MVMIRFTPPDWVAAVIVGLFAVFHVYAHGAELPESAAPLTYSVGFVLSTGLIHIIGIALGLLTKWPFGEKAVRALRGVITGVGLCFLFGLL